MPYEVSYFHTTMIGEKGYTMDHSLEIYILRVVHFDKLLSSLSRLMDGEISGIIHWKPIQVNCIKIEKPNYLRCLSVLCQGSLEELIVIASSLADRKSVV